MEAPEWINLSDDELLERKISKLGLALAGSPVEPLVKQLYDELSQKGLAFHPPCTLQHGQQLRSGVESVLHELGFEVSLASNESHLCCGSAGTYSVLQPALSSRLRSNKLAALNAGGPAVVATANIGCLTHLQAGSVLPVRHWIELIDEVLAEIGYEAKPVTRAQEVDRLTDTIEQSTKTLAHALATLERMQRARAAA